LNRGGVYHLIESEERRRAEMQAHSEFKGGPKQQTVSHVMVSIPSVMRRAYSPKDIIFPAKPLLPHPIYTHWAKLHSY
jgi:hypothetical protein